MTIQFLSGLEVQIGWATHQCCISGISFRRHVTPGYGLWLVLNGAVDARIGQGAWHVPTGHAFFMPTGIMRDIDTDDGAEWLSVGLRATLSGGIDGLHHLPAPMLWEPTDTDRGVLDVWMRQIIQLVATDAQLPLLIAGGLGVALVGLCWQRLGGGPPPYHRPLPPWIERALRTGAENPSITVACLAAEAGYSPARFRQLFHDILGISPRAYLRHRRLEVAEQLLSASDTPIQRIAVHLGFENPAHFTRFFISARGMSPSQYRHAARGPVA